MVIFLPPFWLDMDEFDELEELTLSCVWAAAITARLSANIRTMRFISASTYSADFRRAALNSHAHLCRDVRRGSAPAALPENALLCFSCTILLITDPGGRFLLRRTANISCRRHAP